LYFISANGSNRVSRAEQNMKGKVVLPRPSGDKPYLAQDLRPTGKSSAPSQARPDTWHEYR